MDLSSAVTMEGPLEKESPSVFKVFQSRYFAVRGKGEYLVWFKKKPQNPDQNPQGIINLDTVSEVRQNQSDDKVFSIEYLQRKFVLRAQTELVKERWVNSLKLIIAHHQKLNKNRNKQANNQNESWKWKSVNNKDITEQIRLENQQMILQDGEDSKGNQNDEMMLHVFKDKLHEPDLEKCLMTGFYLKKGMLTNTNRWFMMASQANMYDENDEQLYTCIPEILEHVSETKKQTAKPEQSQTKKRRRQSSSDEESEEQREKKEKQQNKSILKTNVLYEYDPETKALKHSYSLVNIVSYEMMPSEAPFGLKILYEEMVNEEEQETKEVEIVLLSNFLIQIKRLYQTINLLFDRFSISQQREKMLNTRSKRYIIKKWRNEGDESWIVPEKSTDSFVVLINRETLRFNKIEIGLTLIQSHKEETFKSASEEQKDNSGMSIKYKTNGQQAQIKTVQLLMAPGQAQKMNKKLARNLKRISQENKKREQQQQLQKKIPEQKKINQETYLIDKKTRETHNSIKVNFYDVMEREVVAEKTQDKGNSNSTGFWNMISSFFCAAPSGHDSF